jgi:hypothetical protein
MILCEGDVLRRAIDVRAAEAVVSVIFSHGFATTMGRVHVLPLRCHRLHRGHFTRLHISRCFRESVGVVIDRAD